MAKETIAGQTIQSLIEIYNHADIKLVFNADDLISELNFLNDLKLFYKKR